MKRMLGVALVAGLAFAPVSAFALDKAQGVVQNADIFAGVLTIRSDGDDARDMSFNVSSDVNFYELFLEPGDRVTVEFDKTECGERPECVPTAQNIVPSS